MVHQTVALWSDGPCLSVQVAFWAKALEGAPQMLQLPGAMSRPEVSCGTGYTLPFELTKAEYTALQELGRQHSASVLMLITAVFKVRRAVFPLSWRPVPSLQPLQIDCLHIPEMLGV